MEATIKFKNGDEITAQVNGDCFITNAKPEFPDDLTNLEITKDGQVTVILEAMLIECASVDGKYWFSFMEKPLNIRQAEEIEKLKNENEMLIECILEMSEVVYGDE